MLRRTLSRNVAALLTALGAKIKGALSIEAAILSTRQAEVIPFIAQTGSIGVNPSGQAPDVIAISEQTEPF